MYLSPDLPTVQSGGRSDSGSMAAMAFWGSGTAASSASTWAGLSPLPVRPREPDVAAEAGSGDPPATAAVAAAGMPAASVRSSTGGAVKSRSCCGPSTPTLLRTPASDCKTPGNVWATAGEVPATLAARAWPHPAS